MGNVDAYYFPGYSLTCATRFDSTSADPAVHYFQVVAHTSDRWTFWVSKTDSSYSVDNLAPAPPAMLAGAADYGPTRLTMTWAPNTEADLAGYNVYRGTDPGFVTGGESFLTSTTDTTTTDGAWTPQGGYYYKVRAADIHGNESPASVLSPDLITTADTPALPRQLAVDVYPNPFNPSTTLALSLPSRGPVSVVVYDVAGRRVETLVDHVQYDGGIHRIPYNPALPAGVYFVRVTAGAAGVSHKITLAK
jgi:hypothetical protein